MTRQVLEGITHGAAGYKRGCRCKVCCTAKSEQRAAENRRRVERERGAQIVAEPATLPSGPVTRLGQGSPDTGRPGPGDCEIAVRAQLELHIGVPEIGALTSIAIALAKEIDNPSAPSIAGSARQLVATLTEIAVHAKGTDDQFGAFLAKFDRPRPAAVRDTA